jgi:hypothetical protein
VRGIDLLAFADALPDEPKEYRRLRGLMRDTSDIHSAYSDLMLAAGLATRAIEFDNNEGVLPRDLSDDCTIALISSAIIYYARATTTQSRHRKTFDIRARLDENELKDHALICGLRDDAIAHYGPGPLSPTVALREDRMFLPEGGQQIMMASRHMAHSKSLARLIRRQAQRALIITQRAVFEREAKMVDALNNAIVADPRLTEAAKKYEVDLGKVMGDPEMVAQALSGPRIGTRRIHGAYRVTEEE